MIDIPKNCPSCNSKLERVGPNLFCRNSKCGDKQKKIVQGYAQKIKLKGLGIRTVEKLELKEIQDIYDLTSEEIVEAIGEKLGNKLMLEIEKAKHLSLGSFLAASSIYLIGSSAAKKIDAFTNEPNELTYDNLRNIGLGEVASNSLVDWLENEYKYAEFPIIFAEKKESIETTMKVCITGRLNGYTKASATELLSTYGVEVVSTVNQADILLLNERKGSAKEKQAEKLNKPILTMDQLLEKLKDDYKN